MKARKPTSEAQLIVDHLISLTNTEIAQFLKRNKVRIARTKDELRAIIRDRLNDGRLTLVKIVEFLDEVTPWGKQHVYLYTGSSTLAKQWRDTRWVTTQLNKHRLGALLNTTSNRLVLPEKLKLAVIEWNPKKLRITAVRKRQGWIRDEDYDKTSGKSNDGRPLWLKAFVHQVLRGITAFEWNLVANEAFLQITQLPSGGSYESAAAEFAREVASWLNLSTFKPVKLGRALQVLQEQEERGKAPAESHGIDYSLLGPRRVSVRSTSSKVPLRGNRTLDGMMRTLRQDGIPRIGDVYWKANGTRSNGDRTTSRSSHTIIVADKDRVNFKTTTAEAEVRRVLTELRKLSS